MPIIFQPNVVSTPVTREVLEKLKDYVPASFNFIVTSILRDEYSQLRVINNYATSYGIGYPEFNSSKPYDKVFVNEFEYEVYSWQRTWSKLLEMGVIINPPLEAVVLYDYIRNGVNKKGKTIGQSPHARGKAIDVSGRNGIVPVTDILQEAKSGGVGIAYWLVERANNAVHVDCV